MTILLILFVLSGCLLAALAIPLIQGKVGPNPWYGFRVPSTLADPVVWYAANRYSAKCFLAVGIANSVTAVILYFVPGMDIAVYGIACGVIALGGITVALIQSFRHLRSVNTRLKPIDET